MKINIKNFNFNGVDYNLHVDEDQLKFNAETRQIFNKHNLEEYPDGFCTTSEIIKDFEIYKNGNTRYYIHKNIIPKMWLSDSKNIKIYLQSIIKSAMIEVYLNKHEEDKSFSKYIYTHDKDTHILYRKISKTYVDRLDMFKCNFEMTDGVKSIRHFGTKIGSYCYSNNRRENNRAENNNFVRALMYGPNFLNRPLFDPFTRNLMENYSLFNEEKQETITVSTYSLHHALFANGKSINKYDNEPSKFLNQTIYTNYSKEVILEMLGCIALGEDGHKIIHATHRQDDVIGWINRYKRGECFWIPYHWINESNYNDTITWLSKCNKNVDITTFCKYADFITLNSL
jgi:uncharacterized UPF0160 family protein